MSRALWATGAAATYGRAAAPGAPLRMVAAGKAAAAMARTAAESFGSRAVEAVVADPSNAGHPVPDEGSERAGRRALALAESMSADETLVVLLSGGASALLAVPADGLTLADKQRATDLLLRSGADIRALNGVRKHLSAIKGGRLAARARGRTRAYVVSDVVGDDLAVIGSGPTVPDPSTYADALGTIDAFGGRAAYPAAVVQRLLDGVAGRHDETPKRLDRAETTIIGSRRDAMDGAAARARALGYHVTVADEPVLGFARDAAPAFVRELAARLAGAPRPLCAIASGETTVRVVGAGAGGRNQEFALAAARHLALLGPNAVLASVGTDGVDGVTPSAGAVVDSTTLARARAANLQSPESFLANNNTWAFFGALDDLINTGPTGTNVGDLQVVLLA